MFEKITQYKKLVKIEDTWIDPVEVSIVAKSVFNDRQTKVTLNNGREILFRVTSPDDVVKKLFAKGTSDG